MKRHIKKTLSILLSVCILLVSCAMLFAQAAVSYYTETIYTLSEDGARDIVSLIESQTFTSADVEEVCDLMYYFILQSPFAAVGGGSFPYPNSRSYFSYITDGTYAASITGATGCLAYTRWVAKLVFGDDGYANRTYLTRNGGVTAESVESFITKNMQAGEHIRLENAPHSITYIASDANGFYCMDYWSNPGGILLHYTTFAQFALKCNALGGEVYIYESDSAINTVASYTVEPELLCAVTNGANLTAENCYVGETSHFVYGLFDGSSGRYLDIRYNLEYKVNVSVNAPDGKQVVNAEYTTDGEATSFVPESTGVYTAAVTAQGAFPGDKITKTMSFNVTSGSSSEDGSLSSGASGITLSLSELTLAMGLSSRLFATLPDGASVTEWTSSNTQAATVTQDGTVSAVLPGKTTVTVTAKTAEGKTIKAECPVTVRGDAVAGDMDLDGVITETDFSILNSFLAGSKTLTDEQRFRSDANGDGKTDSADAEEINNYVNMYSMWMAADDLFTEITVTSAPAKIKYAYGETLDIAGLKIAAIFDNTLSYTVSSGFTISGYNPLVTGDQQVTVSYGPYKVPFTVTVAGKINSISYDINEGFVAPASTTVPENGKTTVTSVVPQKVGYDFLGWSQSSSGSVDYNPSDSITASGSITLHACWAKKTYTVSFDLNGGTGEFEDKKKEFGSSLVFNDSVPTRGTNTFLGWAEAKDAEAADYKPGDTLYTNSDITLYAVWEGCLEHVSAWRIVTPSTETEEGTAEEYCSVCEELLEGKNSVPLLNMCSLTESEESKLVRDEESGICIADLDDTAAQLTANFSNTLKVAVSDKNGVLFENENKLATGCKLCLLTDYGMVLDSIEIAVIGDVDGDATVTSADARLALRESVALESLQNAYLRACDVDGEGVSASDARLILRYSVGLEERLSAVSEEEMTTGTQEEMTTGTQEEMTTGTQEEITTGTQEEITTAAEEDITTGIEENP